ncbi:MAG: ABC transporter permease [Thermoleophilaceae bacterium]
MTGSTFPTQVYVSARRSLLNGVRSPEAFIPNVAVALFFLVVYKGTLGSLVDLPGFPADDYLPYVMPVALLTGAIGTAAGAGVGLTNDIESGYFDRQLSMPISRAAVVLGPMIASVVQVLVASLLVLGVALALGMGAETGVAGCAVVIVMALVWGLAFAGYAAATGLRSGNAQTVQAAIFLFFPLVFLSNGFIPTNRMEGWMQTITSINPTTYVFNGMRALLIDGWRGWEILQAFIWAGTFAVVTLGLATFAARVAVSRR